MMPIVSVVPPEAASVSERQLFGTGSDKDRRARCPAFASVPFIRSCVFIKRYESTIDNCYIIWRLR